MHLNIKVSIVESGFFHTSIANARKEGRRAIEDYRQVRGRAVSQLMEDIEKGGDPAVVAETIVGIIDSSAPKLRYPVGREKCYLLLRRILPASEMESGVRKHWHIEARFVNCSMPTSRKLKLIMKSAVNRVGGRTEHRTRRGTWS